MKSLPNLLITSLLTFLSFETAAQQASTPASANSTQATAAPVAKAPVRDPQALAVLNQVLAASGGVTAVTTIRDVTVTGSITYFWAGQEVQGTAKVLSRGPDQFRLDATVPQGTRSWAVNHGAGTLKDVDGATNALPYQSIANLGGLTFPLYGLTAALQNTTTTVADIGIVDLNGLKAHQIHVRRNLGVTTDPNGTLSQLSAVDYFFDASSLQLVKTIDYLRPKLGSPEQYLHEIMFSDYKAVSGVMVPFSITEQIAGQRTWAIRLTQISFNQGLSDSDFHL